EPQIANGSHRQKVRGEQPIQAVADDCHLRRIEAAPALIALEHVRGADIKSKAMRLDDALGKGGDIAKAEIQSLPGNRMDAVGGIADERQAVRHKTPGNRELKREDLPRPDRPDWPESMAETALELDLEGEIVAGYELRGAVLLLRPH